jgi:hypothetical protein
VAIQSAVQVWQKLYITWSKVTGKKLEDIWVHCHWACAEAW